MKWATALDPAHGGRRSCTTVRGSLQLLAIALAIVIILATGPRVTAAERPPNVVFILADDLGWRDLSGEGSAFYETPNIDRIGDEGMRFTRGYATCQVCSPSRASIMTGKYPARLAITDWIGAAQGHEWKRNTRLLPAFYRHELPGTDITLAEAFREAGYRTFFAGKWHLGGEGSLPQDHGFDVNIGGHHRGSPPGGYFSPYDNPQMASGPNGEYLPLRLGDETARFIEANGDRPFFVFLSFYAVHAPMQTTEALWSKYRNKAARQPAPDHRFIVDRTLPVRQVQDHPIYAGLVESMDRAVGTVLATLDRLGLAESTIVVFTSDNGGVAAGDAKATSNLPLRGGKGRQWEGGLRVPVYFRWPHVVIAGSESATPVTGTDFYPTLLELAGLHLRPEQHVDGVSLVPLFKHGTTASRPLFWHYPHYGNQGGEPSSIVNHDDWKLIYYHEDGRRELYHLATDKGEQNDLAAEQPERVNALTATLFTWMQSTDARLPFPNPVFDPVGHARDQARVRSSGIAELEQEHAAFHDPDWSPPGGWWEHRGN